MARFLLAAAFLCASFAHAQDFDVKIWEGVKMPGTVCVDKNSPKISYDEAKKILGKNPNISSGKYGQGNEGCQRVVEPTLRCFKAVSDSKKPMPAIIICPGGGYSHLAMGHEGNDIAKFLAENGTTCFVLAYRIPGNNRESALMDVQRAIRLVRKNAKKWNVDPSKIGVMGFSAGGHLSANASTNYGREVYA
ncbi:MAG: alpha/beta hydrolase, partial [Opitutales bacterium]|nr:alpha/beta hydrolase [Opitutales bacterium]